ncbi:hypothetical protein QR680_002640 [Steinernema hermaphroditum]|uniref:t-SNARE coiled-coil homology domain-containing protein n=1 Tax=Steinernema hermaphroditum TaxID=289476 RepID=A0AA39H5L4_9BILA|nr:hypothetical protein QR680_002640 [Steinernema hermaphroditum]
MEEQNNQMADQLSSKVSVLKRITIAIGDDVREQNRFLNEVESDFDSSKSLLGSTMRKLTSVYRAGAMNTTPPRSSPVSAMNTTPPPSTPVYAVFVPASVGSPTGEVFKTLREASSFATSPLPKRYGARFKRFDNQQEADEYVRNGMGNKPSAATNNNIAPEPTVPYPAPSRPQLNEVKRAIEKLDNKQFEKLSEENPRVLINTQADTPTIIAEGCRYNALHLAARSGNLFVTEYVLHLVQDQDKLAKIYGTPDIGFRSAVLLENFLTTPDKGENSTPLHFASKFGEDKIVALLASFPMCNLSSRNRYAMSPADVVCERATGESRVQRSANIRRHLGAYYVGFYRSSDGDPILAPPTHRYPPRVRDPPSDAASLCNGNARNVLKTSPVKIAPLLSRLSAASTPALEQIETFNLKAVAGPFETEKKASDFYVLWNTTGKEIKLCDALRGYENVGRQLAQDQEVMFAEHCPSIRSLITTFDPDDDKFYDTDEYIETSSEEDEYHTPPSSPKAKMPRM